ncbi:hypothetical protein [Streptomyces sp. NPDC051001]|uniref:hypothetical protein n=1 Tax=Streptomyces sp. NPDC051001 TaxID=3155795 RepID=UPI003447DB83
MGGDRLGLFEVWEVPGAGYDNAFEAVGEQVVHAVAHLHGEAVVVGTVEIERRDGDGVRRARSPVGEFRENLY